MCSSNFSLRCSLRPKESDSNNDWKLKDQCHRNSVSVTRWAHGSRGSACGLWQFTHENWSPIHAVCDENSCTYLVPCNQEVYGFIPLTKEDCINHVKKKKRMGTTLYALIKKGPQGVPLGGRGALTQELMKILTTYYTFNRLGVITIST